MIYSVTITVTDLIDLHNQVLNGGRKRFPPRMWKPLPDDLLREFLQYFFEKRLRWSQEDVIRNTNTILFRDYFLFTMLKNRFHGNYDKLLHFVYPNCSIKRNKQSRTSVSKKHIKTPDQREYSRKHYNENKQYYLDHQQENIERTRVNNRAYYARKRLKETGKLPNVLEKARKPTPSPSVLDKRCVVCGTTVGKIYNSKKYHQQLCTKHYSQLQQHGEISLFTRYDTNKIILHKDCAEILLRNKQGENVKSVFIDLEDVDKVKDYIWSLMSGRVYCRSLDTSLSRFLLNITDKAINVTFKDKDYLNCRKSNLLAGPPSKRGANRRISSNNTSGYKGVCWNKTANRWMAYIQAEGKSKTLGYFTDIIDAIAARKDAEDKYFGEFAYDPSKDAPLKRENNYDDK